MEANFKYIFLKSHVTLEYVMPLHVHPFENHCSLENRLKSMLPSISQEVNTT